MDGTPLLSPNVPRFAPPRPHTRTPSRSPTRNRPADDILSDLSPATTLEAFTNASGKLRASIEAATPSERAFGLRATVASKKIQEWADELSSWPWPVEGGSLGFEIPSAKRRKLSVQDEDRGRRNSNSNGGKEPEYFGFLLAAEVDRYENRIDDITADMEDLNVEEIKRQVLDTHFSPRSRPSSSASNAPPMPSLFASYTRMDDFTAVVTATVLQSLPNLSRLTRLMDVWNIRLSVLRKVPPLMLALDAAEIALKSGWTAIQNSEIKGSTMQQQVEPYLSRKTFDTIRDTLQDQVTTLGQHLDYMLDTLEGRQDTLPEAWLDRMETIENDYGSWVVSGDRKVREGEWASMAKARKEKDITRKKEADAAESERRDEEAARKKSQKDSEAAEAEMLEAEEETRKAATLQALKAAQEAAQQKAEEDSREIARLQALREFEKAETARTLAAQQAQGKEKAQEAAREQVREAEEAEAVQSLFRAEVARLEAEEEARELSRQQAWTDAEAEAVRATAEHDAFEAAQQQAFKEAEGVRLIAQRQAEAAELASLKVEREAENAVQKSKQDDQLTEMRRREQDAEVFRQKELLVAESLLVSKRKAEQEKFALTQAQQETRFRPVKDMQDVETARQTQKDAKFVRTKTQQQINTPKSAKDTRYATSWATGPEPARQAEADCDICAELQQTNATSPQPPSPVNMGAAVNSGVVRAQNFVDSITTANLDDAVSPQISQYAPFDGSFEVSDPAIRQTEVEVSEKGPTSLDLASPIHLDDSFPQTPTSSTVSSTARVFTSPTSEDSTSPPSSKLPFGNAFANVVRVSSSPSPEQQSSPVSPRDPNGASLATRPTPTAAPQAPSRSELSLDGANDSRQSDVIWSSDENWIKVNSPQESNAEYVRDQDAAERQSEVESLRVRISAVDHYSPPNPALARHDEQGAEDFTVSQAKNQQSFTRPVPITPSASSHFTPNTLTRIKPCPTSDSAINSSRTPSHNAQSSDNSCNSILSPVTEELSRCTKLQTLDGPCEGCEIAIRDLVENEIELPMLAEGSPISRMISPSGRIAIPHRASISSNTSTVINGRRSESPSSPIASPVVEDANESSIEDHEQSPSTGRIGHRSVRSYDLSPPGSPRGMPERPSLHLEKSPTFTPLDDTAPLTPKTSITSPSTPFEAPVFGNVDVSTVPIIHSPKKANSDEQIQQQISSLLESIPARIRLTSDPDDTPFSSQTLRPKKTRRSITPSFRPSSSMSNYSTSSRAPTPSFTLAPAFSKTSSRPRPLSSNPEIKLYHLSRSTGEAPIKLFVRLVGEHGERVMVRVGGGWADLGEYLKEYASHHGRRSAVESADKVEIQDLPSRNVSSSSTATLRGNGRSSPIPRPQSVLESERPGSSLFVRKTRKSVGESSSSDPINITRLSNVRSPSTPLPSTLNHRSYETPPSAASSNSTGPSGRSSRLSWTEEDSSLGLAGPKSKKVTISERDQEWVESMKEKVRLASAEKEKRERERERMREKGEQRKTSFGEMEKVGGTKRLFRKGI